MAKTCVMCGTKVGIGSYKISDGNIACSSCMKKAGYGMTTPYKVIRSLTVEDLTKDPSQKKMIGQKEQHTSVGQEKMTAADEMATFCETYGYGQGQSRKWTLKHFKVIEDSLASDEYAIFCFVGLHNYVSATKHDNNFAYALTNKRLICAQQKLVGNQVQSILLDKLNDITKSRGALLGTLTIDTLNEKLNVAVDKITTDRIASALNEIIYNLKHTHSANTQTVINNAPSLSASDEIRQFKALLDDGIISQEEFDAKKKELLGL
ncbi:PH domain-containing protein [Enterococcus asini]|uniref:PH domain-containing protein n=1 Tax=Enterococcus asini TaxID=57732 RepID=UPI002891F1D8|nr:PH domain-containing protein [Enterococcus asini]MDT2743979.1 SHOCT domain-containing protein [Enterococcus asini]